MDDLKDQTVYVQAATPQALPTGLSPVDKVTRCGRAHPDLTLALVFILFLMN
jgi:hypothetical protein